MITAANWRESARVRPTGSKLVVPPDPVPLPLEVLKLRLRLDAEELEPEIESLFRAAVDEVEGYTGLALMERQLDLYYPLLGCRHMLRPGPVVSVDEVAYIEPETSTEAALNPELYYEDLVATPQLVVIPPASGLPKVGDVPTPVRIRVTVGYGTALDDIPDALIAAAILFESIVIDANPASAEATRMAAQALMDRHKVVVL